MELKDLLNKSGEISFPIKSVEASKQDEGVLVITGFANKAFLEDGSEVKDRDGDVILPSAYNLDSFMKNPIILYQHDKSQPIGRAIEVKTTADGLVLTAEIYRDLNPQAYAGVKMKALTTFSIGFMGKDGKYVAETDTFYFTEIELLETSVVSIPSNQESIFEVVDSPCGIAGCMLAVSHATEKGYVQKNEQVPDISTKDWKDVNKSDLSSQLFEANDESLIKDAYLAVGDVANKSSWKFPHHELVDGELKLNKSGLASALSALKGAHLDNHFADDVMAEAVAHLVKHYNELMERDSAIEMPEDLAEMAKQYSEGEGMDEQLKELAASVAELQKELEKLKGQNAEDPQSQEASEKDVETEESNVEADVEKEFSVEDAMELLKATDTDIEQLMKFYEEFGAILNEKLTSALETADDEINE